MQSTETPGKTLFDLRVERGLKHEDVVARIAEITGEEPKHWTASAHYERRGIQSIDLIEAIAKIYELDIADVRAAAKNSKKFGIPAEARRQKRTHLL